MTHLPFHSQETHSSFVPVPVVLQPCMGQKVAFLAGRRSGTFPCQEKDSQNMVLSSDWPLDFRINVAEAKVLIYKYCHLVSFRSACRLHLPQFSGYCSEISKVSSARKNMIVKGLSHKPYINKFIKLCQQKCRPICKSSITWLLLPFMELFKVV